MQSPEKTKEAIRDLEARQNEKARFRDEEIRGGDMRACDGDGVFVDDAY